MTRQKSPGVVVIGLLLVFCGFEIYHSTGFVRATRKPGSWYNGCICHGDFPSQFVQVTISGPESLGIGQVGSYVLRIVKDTNIAAGFNVASFVGDLMVGDSLEQQIMDGELTHTLPKLSSGSDTIEWVFYYQAPEVSMYDTLYAVGNSIDTSYDPFGDWWNFSENFVVRVGNPSSMTSGQSPVARHYRLFQNYPNPFNPSTIIRYRLPLSDFVSLKVYDIVGREVALLVEGHQEAGEHECIFDAGHLSSGVYLYRLVASSFTETKKMVFVP